MQDQNIPASDEQHEEQDQVVKTDALPEQRASTAVTVGTFLVPTPAFLALPPHPAQRDHLLRAQDATLRSHLANPMDVHRNVTAIAMLENGQTLQGLETAFAEAPRDALGTFCLKADGHTRAFLWETEQVPVPATVRVTVIACATEEDAIRVYDSFDSKASVKSSANEMQSLMRYLQMAPTNPLVQAGQFRVALSLANHLLNGVVGVSFPRALPAARIAADVSDAERIEAMHPILPVLRAWMGPVMALDGILADKEAVPAAQGYLAGYLVLLRRDADEGRDEGRRFLTDLANNPGTTMDGQADAIAFLKRTPEWVKANQPDLRNSEKLQLEAAVVFAAFNAWKANDTFSENTSPMRLRRLALTFYTPAKDEADARRAAEAREQRAAQVRAERANARKQRGTTQPSMAI
ncbi:hypothetical protein [Neoroseomonas rubea]|uniref:hypothetical protein n=1 Tax=Neoroseomonas rubea TaxID=2748666 RepID=UPI0018DF1971|nr:hypothetical protein [Roseomonas rubea]